MLPAHSYHSCFGVFVLLGQGLKEPRLVPKLLYTSRLALSLWSSCLHSPPVGISGMHHSIWLIPASFINPFLWGLGHISPQVLSLCLSLRLQVSSNDVMTVVTVVNSEETWRSSNCPKGSLGYPASIAKCLEMHMFVSIISSCPLLLLSIYKMLFYNLKVFYKMLKFYKLFIIIFVNL